VKAVLNSEVGFTSQAYGAMDQYVAAPPPSARHLLQDETEEMYTTLLEEIRTLSSQQKALENQVRDALRPVPKPRPRVGELVVCVCVCCEVHLRVECIACSATRAQGRRSHGVAPDVIGLASVLVQLAVSW
jgi:hypothetical protein